jgi:hypothetical protein
MALLRMGAALVARWNPDFEKARHEARRWLSRHIEGFRLRGKAHKQQQINPRGSATPLVRSTIC